MHFISKHAIGRMGEFELSELCRQGNNLARKELYERFAGKLFGICIRYAGDRDTAKDLLHDGFIKIYSSFDKFTWRGDGSLKAWMERIIINTALQYLRKNDVMNLTTELDEKTENYDESESPDIDIVPQEILMQFISELPDGYRTVFNLYVFEEKSHKEIGQLLDINEKSSASQFYRAKTTLAKKIKEYQLSHVLK